MKILVTGATGFIGSELTRQLVAQEVPVRILRRSTSTLDLLGASAAHVEHALGDVLDPDSLADAFEGITHAYHTAAAIVFDGKRGREQLFQVNVKGTRNVVAAALEAGVERLVHTSSMAAFGRPEQEGAVLDETAAWSPSRYNSAYAASKYESELEVHRGIAEGLDAILVNPALVFGVGRPGDNTRQIVDKVRREKLPATPSGGTNVVDVIDVAAGHIKAMEHGEAGARYFLGSENLSWQAIIGTLADAFGVKPPRFVLPPKPTLALGAVFEAVAALTRTRPLLTRETARNAASFYRYDNRKAIDELGCTFRPFEETAHRIAAALG